MKTENQYIIAFKGLKEGSYDFIFYVGKSFIEEHEFLEARDGKLEVKVNMVKKVTHLAFTIAIYGFLEVQCDRCLDFFHLDIHFNGDLCAKFSETTGESDSEVMVLNPEEGEIDLKQYIYESIGLSIPYRKIHPPDNNSEPSCNREMLARLEKNIISGDNKNNPVWDKLKDLM